MILTPRENSRNSTHVDSESLNETLLNFSDEKLNERLKVRGIKNMAFIKSLYVAILFFRPLSSEIVHRITPPIIITIIINFSHIGSKIGGGQTNIRHLKIYPPIIDRGKRIMAPKGIHISEGLLINILSALNS